MTSTYTPTPGSTAARVIAFLEAMPASRWVPTAELAEAVGMECKDMAACLNYAVKAGMLARRSDPADTRRKQWCLGDGKPLADPADEDGDDGADDELSADAGPTERLMHVLGQLPPGEWIGTQDLALRAKVPPKCIPSRITVQLRSGEVERMSPADDARRKLWRLRPDGQAGAATMLESAAQRLAAAVSAPGVVHAALARPRPGAGAQAAMALTRDDGKARSTTDVVMVLAKGRAITPTPAEPLPVPELRMAQWSTGELQIVLGLNTMLLAPEQVRKLAAFMQLGVQLGETLGTRAAA